MSASGEVTVICTYRVKQGEENGFENLLKQHWPTLRNFGLATEEAPMLFRGKDNYGPFYVEIFSWVDANASNEAHNTPEVMKVWEQMGGLVEDRGGRPKMEFPHVERLSL